MKGGRPGKRHLGKSYVTSLLFSSTPLSQALRSPLTQTKHVSSLSYPSVKCQYQQPKIEVVSSLFCRGGRHCFALIRDNNK